MVTEHIYSLSWQSELEHYSGNMHAFPIAKEKHGPYKHASAAGSGQNKISQSRDLCTET